MDVRVRDQKGPSILHISKYVSGIGCEVSKFENIRHRLTVRKTSRNDDGHRSRFSVKKASKAKRNILSEKCAFSSKNMQKN